MPDVSTEQASLPDQLSRDSSFWGMTMTQFLGGFNDNVFKQVACLMCVDVVQRQQASSDPQWLAQTSFALPFILFSGFAGFLADRTSKRKIVVLCKVAEIGIMAAGTAAIWSGQLSAVLTVLFLMGTHSAFFGPSKYGILPELAQEKNLSLANGLFLMTTFLAIIFGMGLGGLLKSKLPDGVFLVGGTMVAIAVLGTMSAQLVRRTPVAHPGLKFKFSDMLISGETVRMFRGDRPLLLALSMYSFFWLLAAVVQSTVNSFAKIQLGYDDTKAALLAASLALGIAVGCITAGLVSGRTINWKLVRVGSSGICLALSLLGALSLKVIHELPDGLYWQQVAAWPLLAGLGFSTGMFTVPLQVFVQSRPPADQKGRVIGAMNLTNWIGVFLAGPLYGGLFWLFRTWLTWPISSIYGACAVLILPVAVLYRPDRQAIPPRTPDAIQHVDPPGSI